MISEKRLQPVRTIGFFCTVIFLKIFNLSHLLLDLAPSVECSKCTCRLVRRPGQIMMVTRPGTVTWVVTSSKVANLQMRPGVGPTIAWFL